MDCPYFYRTSRLAWRGWQAERSGERQFQAGSFDRYYANIVEGKKEQRELR